MVKIVAVAECDYQDSLCYKHVHQGNVRSSCGIRDTWFDPETQVRSLRICQMPARSFRCNIGGFILQNQQSLRRSFMRGRWLQRN